MSDAGAELVLVVARARNGVIGKDGRLPWRIPADLKHFKAVTICRREAGSFRIRAISSAIWSISRPSGACQCRHCLP